ncbi:MAG: succinate dehydrogenase assembly factor 2 [Gammaproteobacteria bacterium]
MTKNAEINHIKWQCRRGMLENDIVLLRFVEHHYATLSKEQKATFLKLLQESDQTLLPWLTGISEPENRAYQALIRIIRDEKAPDTSHDV